MVDDNNVVDTMRNCVEKHVTINYNSISSTKSVNRIELDSKRVVNYGQEINSEHYNERIIINEGSNPSYKLITNENDVIDATA